MSTGAEYGAILPNNQPSSLETIQQMRMYQDRQQQQQQARQAQMAKYLSDTLDFQNYGTGTELDPVIHQNLNNLLNQGMGRIMGDKKYSWPQMIYDMSDGARKLSDYSGRAKLIDAQLKNQAAQYAKNKSIDPIALYKYGKIAAFHDGNGGLRSLEQLDPNQDYGQQALDQYGDQIVKGSGALDDLIQNGKMIPYKKKFTVNQNGSKRIMGYEGKYNPMYHQLTDEKGNPVDDNGNATGVAVRGTPVTIGGRQMMGVDDNTLNHFTSDLGAKAFLNNLTKKVTAQFPDANPSDVQKVLLHEYLSNDKTGYINNVENVADDSQIYHNQEMKARQEEAFQNRLLLKQMSGGGKENPFGVMGQIASGQITDGVPTDDGMIDVTGQLPGAALFSGKVVKTPNSGAVKDAYNALHFDPRTNKFYTVDQHYDMDENGQKKTDATTGKPIVLTDKKPIAKDQLQTWIRNIARANGVSPDKAWQDFSGNYNPSTYDDDPLKGVQKKSLFQKTIDNINFFKKK